MVTAADRLTCFCHRCVRACWEGRTVLAMCGRWNWSQLGRQLRHQALRTEKMRERSAFLFACWSANLSALAAASSSTTPVPPRRLLSQVCLARARAKSFVVNS